MIRPGFHRGRLWHRRQEPSHAFSRDLLLAVADVDAIDAAPEGELALAGRWPISLRRADGRQLGAACTRPGALPPCRRTTPRRCCAAARPQWGVGCACAGPPGRRHTKGYMPRQELQTCARMKELTERIQNHIGFMGSFRR